MIHKKILFILFISIILLAFSNFIIHKFFTKPVVFMDYLKTGDKVTIYAFGYDEFERNGGITELALYIDDQLVKKQSYKKPGLKYSHLSFELDLKEAQSHIYYSKVINAKGARCFSKKLRF